MTQHTQGEWEEVSKEKFFAFFDTKLGITTGCPLSHKVWDVRHNGVLIARSEKTDSGEHYSIKSIAAAKGH